MQIHFFFRYLVFTFAILYAKLYLVRNEISCGTLFSTHPETVFHTYIILSLYGGYSQMAQKVQFVETVLRDANQSLIATRLPFEKFEPMLETIDKAGYYAAECWGGATFDV